LVAVAKRKDFYQDSNEEKKRTALEGVLYIERAFQVTNERLLAAYSGQRDYQPTLCLSVV